MIKLKSNYCFKERLTCYLPLVFMYGIQLLIVGHSEALSIFDEIKSFDVIQPLHFHDRRKKNDLSTRGKNGTHLKNTSFYLSSLKYNINFKIDIELNRDLFTHNYHVRYQQANGDLIKSQDPVDHCYYQGVIDNFPDSVVVMSTCNGLRGVIYHGPDIYHIYPEENDNKENLDISTNHVFFHSKDYIASNESCGTHHKKDKRFAEDLLMNHKLVRRASDRNMMHISLVLVIDKRTYEKFGSSKIKAGARAIEVANYMDRVYKTINTRVPLVWVEVWNVYDLITVTTDPRNTLIEFEKYSAQVLLKDRDYTFDNMQFLTGIDFDGTTVGMAGISTICTPRSCGVNMDRGKSLVPTGNTVSHEMGHNLGMTHDDNIARVTTVGRWPLYRADCTCSTPPCVMTPTASHFQVNGFSSCSVNEFQKEIDKGEAACLLDVPPKLFGDPVCGNAFLEEGEDCDCGSVEECERYGGYKCCNATTCKLTETAQCAVGDCCNDCQFKTKGTLCRGNEHECDLKEYCTGSSELCPTNYYKHDGTECGRDQGYCYDGACRTIDDQCVNYWGNGARKGEYTCYNRLNKKGTGEGNCGKDSRGAFVQCQERNLYCGKLQCKDMTQKFPSFKGKILATTFRYGLLSCRTATVTLTDDSSDPTMTADGTKCAEGHMCLNQVCRNLTQIESIKKCGGCANGGICNNLGNCHCPYGYACPDCKEEGIGGSANSGQGCIVGLPESGGLSGTAIGLLIFFLLIVPLVLAAAYLTYRFRDRLPIKKKAVISSKRPQRRSFSKFRDEKPKPTGIDNPAGPTTANGQRKPPPIGPPKTIHSSKPVLPSVPTQSRGPPARTAPSAPVRTAPTVPLSKAKPPMTPSKPLPNPSIKPSTYKPALRPPPPFPPKA